MYEWTWILDEYKSTHTHFYHYNYEINKMYQTNTVTNESQYLQIQLKNSNILSDHLFIFKKVD